MLVILTPQNTIEDVLQSYPEAQSILATVHLPNCSSCLVRFDETLAEAAANYEFDLQRVLNLLNAGLLRHQMAQQAPVQETLVEARQRHLFALYTEKR